MLSGRQIVMGITGGVAAYKACDVARRLTKLGATVRVIMTENACRFVTPLSFESLTGQPVVTDMFKSPERWEVEHIALAKRAELFLIAPATANILGKLAHGIADDMLSTTAMATRAPLLLAPAMNTGMWQNPATVANMKLLEARGVRRVGPGKGLLACGDEGEGRMAEPEDIVKAAVDILCPQKDLAGKRILVTAGPTREPLDPVRYLSNYSSGRMGYALAEAAQARGAEVTLVSGPVELAKPAGVELVPVTTTLSLSEAVLRYGQESDAVLQAAAPADYRPAQVAEQKIKKQKGEGLSLALVENPDIAAALGKQKRPGQVLVAFAAETQHVLENAQAKRVKKNADMIVANDVTQEGAGFHVATNIACLITAQGVEELPLMSKRELADRILDRVAGMLGRGEA